MISEAEIKKIISINNIEHALKIIHNEYINDKSNTILAEEYAHLLSKAKQYNQALDVWNGLIDTFPNNAHYINYRAIVKLNLGDIFCFEDFDLAVQLEPATPFRYASRAFALDRFDKTKEAIEDLKMAIALDDEDEISLNNKLVFEEKLKKSSVINNSKESTITNLETKETISKSKNNDESTLWSEVKKIIFTKQGRMDFLNYLKNK